MFSFIESSTPADYHAAPNNLKLIDEIQVDFLEALGIVSLDAMCYFFSIFPLCVRRDIAMLGIYN